MNFTLKRITDWADLPLSKRKDKGNKKRGPFGPLFY